MSNQYEALRNDIVATINELCIKKSNDGQRVQYKWSYQAVCDDIERANGFKAKAMPDDLKTIIRFEFNKLKAKVQSQDGWTDKTTRIAPSFSQGAIELRRTNVATFDNLSLEDKERGCRYLLDAAGKSLAKADTSEKAMNARKRIRSLEKELGYLQDEIERQNVAFAKALEDAKLLEEKEAKEKLASLPTNEKTSGEIENERELAADVANGQHEGEQ